MAAKTATKNKKSTKPVKPEPVEEVEEDLEEEFDEVEEDEIVETAPAKKSTKKPTTSGRDVTFGVKNICTLISEQTGTEPTTRELRILIRRLARDTKNQRVQREIVAGNRTPYSWTGPNDPEVKAIVKAWLAGEQTIEKNEKLAALKERGEAAKAAGTKTATVKKGPAAKPTKKAKAAKPVVVEEDDDEDLDFDEDDED